MVDRSDSTVALSAILHILPDMKAEPDGDGRTLTELMHHPAERWEG